MGLGPLQGRGGAHTRLAAPHTCHFISWARSLVLLLPSFVSPSERRPANMWLSSVSYLVLSLAPCICSPAGNTDCSQSHRTVLTVLQDCGRGRQNCMFLPHSSLTLCPLKLPPTVVFCFFFPLTWKASSISTIPPGRALCR